jgi:hypothetical protein
MTTDSLANPSAQQLRRAADIQDKIEALQAELARILGTPTVARGKRTMSSTARAKIAAAQRARWRRKRKTAPTATRTVRRKMSAKARAKLAAIARARWKKVKAAGKRRLED